MLHKPCLILRCDNTAVVSISQKLGTSRLRHIEGKLLWLQTKVALEILSLRPVRTHYNVADVGTKGLGRVKHRVMCFLLGLSENNQPIGESEFDELSRQDVLRKEQKALIRRLCFGGNNTVGSLSLAVTLATARAQHDVEQEADALSFVLSVLVAVLLVALGIWWRLSARRATPTEFDEVNTMSRSRTPPEPRRRTSESTFCYNPDSSDGEGYVPPAAAGSAEADQQGEGVDMKNKNLKQIVMMATVIVENMKVENYGPFERNGFMKSLCHLRMLIDINEKGQADHVRKVLDTLDGDKGQSKTMLNQLAHLTPVVILSFREEVEYFERYNYLITEHDKETLKNTDLNAGHAEEEGDQHESEEDKRRRYLFSTIDEVSDVEYWQSLWHHEEEEGDDSEQGEEEIGAMDGGAQREVPTNPEPESEETIARSEQLQREYDQQAEVDAIFRRMEDRARQQEDDGDFAGAERTREIIDSMVQPCTSLLVPASLSTFLAGRLDEAASVGCDARVLTGNNWLILELRGSAQQCLLGAQVVMLLKDLKAKELSYQSQRHSQMQMAS
eukprot:symbB.v1.2.038232.t2/scaffold5857.1/size42504/3